MKSLTVWHGHSTRPSLPVGTARKGKENLLHGRRNRLIMLPSKEKQSVPAGELPVVHIAVVCGFNRKFYKQCNSQQLVCDMQFMVVANESNRELRWQGASYSGAHPVFFTMLHHFLHAASGIRHQHGSESDAAHPGIVPIFCAGMPCKLARKQCHFPAYCPILSA